MPVKFLMARVAKRFRAFSLEVDVEVQPGITAIWGASGAGKSLTLDCIAGFTKPDTGRVAIGDRLLFDAASRLNLPPQKRRCGYIFQDHALFPHMTLRSNLHFAASVSSALSSSLARRRRVNELLEAFQLAEQQGKFAHQLSGGQRQRAALARTLVTDPELLLLDEPTRGLDSPLRENFHQLLLGVQARLNMPVLLVTHDLTECFRIAESILVYVDGRILQAGPIQAVMAKPASRKVAEVLGVFNILPVSISALDPSRNTSRLQLVGTMAEIDGPYLPGHLLGDRGHACIPQAATSVSPVVGSSRTQLVTSVLSTFPAPDGLRLRLTHNITATVRPDLWREWNVPDQVAVRFEPSAVHLVD